MALTACAAGGVPVTVLRAGMFVLSGRDIAAAVTAVIGLAASALLALPVAREGLRRPREVRTAVSIVTAAIAVTAGAALVAIDLAARPDDPHGMLLALNIAVRLGAAAALAPLTVALLLLTAEVHRADDLHHD